jgi:anti-sigma factor RsiW
MTCEQCSELLGEAVDGALDAASRAQVDEHCRGCAACGELLNDLRNIREAAASLERRAPSPEVWRAIQSRIRPSARSSLIRLAAAAAIVLMAGTAAWFAAGRQWLDAPDAPASDLVRNAATELQLAEQHYENAIAALEQLTIARDSALDPSVAAEIALSLKSIDRAIDDSRAALKSDPNSFVAQTSLLEALRMKVALLQETVSLMNARS